MLLRQSTSLHGVRPTEGYYPTSFWIACGKMIEPNYGVRSSPRTAIIHRMHSSWLTLRARLWDLGHVV